MTVQSIARLISILALASGALAAQSMAPSGSFGFLITDFFVDTRDGNGAAILGLMNFDGAGNVTGTYTLQGRGPDPASTGTFTGTYSSSPDGTGSVALSLDFGMNLTLAMVITDSGQGLQLVITKCAPASCNIGGGVVQFRGTAQSLNGSLPMSSFAGGASGDIPLTLTSASSQSAGSTVYTAAPAAGQGAVQCQDGSSGTWNASVPLLTVAVAPSGAAAYLLTLSLQSCGHPDAILLSGTADAAISASGASLTLHLPGDVLSGPARAVQPGTSLNGSYGYQSRFSPYPRGEIGTMIFDGAGNVTISSTSVADGSSHGSGQPVIAGATTGTYAVNPDGTGTMTVQGFGQIAFVITDGGSGILFLRLKTTNENDLQFGTARLQ